MVSNYELKVRRYGTSYYNIPLLGSARLRHYKRHSRHIVKEFTVFTACVYDRISTMDMDDLMLWLPSLSRDRFF